MRHGGFYNTMQRSVEDVTTLRRIVGIIDAWRAGTVRYHQREASFREVSGYQAIENHIEIFAGDESWPQLEIYVCLEPGQAGNHVLYRAMDCMTYVKQFGTAIEPQGIRIDVGQDVILFIETYWSQGNILFDGIHVGVWYSKRTSRSELGPSHLETSTWQCTTLHLISHGSPLLSTRNWHYGMTWSGEHYLI